MARKPKGIRRKRNKWQAYVWTAQKFHSKTFPLMTPLEDMRQWQDAILARCSPRPVEHDSFAADIHHYLTRRTAMPTYDQRAAHLALWAQELGRDRSRYSITTAEIEQVLDRWLQRLAPGTVRKRRTALQSFFIAMTGPNPVKGAMNPKSPKAGARGLDYDTIERILAAMPEYRDTKPGEPPRVSLSRIRARVIAYTGLPPGILQAIQAHDLSFTRSTVQVCHRQKGGGLEARTLPLSSEALAAFKIFDAANAYGGFAIQSLNRSLQRACQRVGVDPRTFHLYDLRHSFLSQVYRTTRDTATVARLGLHAEGSPITARYTQAAHEDVDRAAVTAVSADIQGRLIKHPSPTDSVH
jgi:integrase